MNDKEDPKAQLQGIASALERLEAEYGKGEMDVGRYLRLKAQYEARKAALEEEITREQHALLDGPDYAAARVRYLAALRERYGVVETHGFMETVRDERVGKPHRLPLVGEAGVYVSLAFDAPLARRAALESGERPAGKDEAHLRELAEREMQPLFLAGALQLPGHLALIGDVEAAAGLRTVQDVDISVDFVQGGGFGLDEDAGRATVGGYAIQVGAQAFVLSLAALDGLLLGLAFLFLGLSLGLAFLLLGLEFKFAALGPVLDVGPDKDTSDETAN
ncbi:MAG: hypothetical protein PVF45_09320, partial [Anaerolineae bacterium]